MYASTSGATTAASTSAAGGLQRGSNPGDGRAVLRWTELLREDQLVDREDDRDEWQGPTDDRRDERHGSTGPCYQLISPILTVYY